MEYQLLTYKFNFGRLSRYLSIAVALLILQGPPAIAQDEDNQWGFFVDVGYDSRYLFAVDRANALKDRRGGGYYGVTVGASYGNFGVAVWEAYGARDGGLDDKGLDVDHYRETNYIATYGFDITDNLGIEIGRAFLDYEGGSIDNETYLSVDYSKYIWFPSVTYLYSSDLNGGFWTFAWDTEFDSIYGGTLGLVGEFGIDDGYHSEAQDDLNHLSVQAAWTRSITDNFSFNVRAQQVVALESLRRDGNANAFTLGFGVTAEF